MTAYFYTRNKSHICCICNTKKPIKLMEYDFDDAAMPWCWACVRKQERNDEEFVNWGYSYYHLKGNSLCDCKECGENYDSSYSIFFHEEGFTNCEQCFENKFYVIDNFRCSIRANVKNARK